MIIGFAIMTVVYVFIHSSEFLYLFKDQFAKDSMNLNVQWNGFEIWIGALFILSTIIGTIFYLKGKIIKGTASLVIGATITLTALQLFVIPKIEQHTQGAMISFCEEVANQDCYIETYGFKSYAHYFYARTPNHDNIKSKELNWLINGAIDKKVYIITKTTNTSLDNHPNIQFIERRGGFKFYTRDIGQE